MRPLFSAIFPDRMSKDRKTYGYIPERHDTSTRSDDQSLHQLHSRTAVHANDIEIHGGRPGEAKKDIMVRDPDVEIGNPRDGVNVRKDFDIRVQHF